MGQKLEDLPEYDGDFVRRDKVSTIVTDTHIILEALYPNGITRKVKIKKDDFINAIRLCQKSKNLV